MAGFDLNTAFSDVGAAIADGTFDPRGSNFTDFAASSSGSQKSATSPWAYTGLGSIPDLPAVGGSAKFADGQNSILAAAGAANITGGAIPPKATTGSPSAATGGTNSAQNWFARIVIGILGAIFVMEGLRQFGIIGIQTPGVPR